MSTCFYWKTVREEMPVAEMELANGTTLTFDPREMVDDTDPRIHIGKRFHNRKFSWAQDPAGVLKTCKQNSDETLVVDEYGAEYTGEEFLEILSGLNGNVSLVGQNFF